MLRYPATAKLIAQSGHEIGNHSQTHPYLGQIATGEIAWELISCQRAIKEATGAAPTLFRPPYGNVGPGPVEKIAGELALKMVLWDVCTGDWAAKSAEEIVDKIDASDGGIVLLHDGGPNPEADRSFTVKAVEMLLSRYPKETFVKISELTQ